MAEPVDLADTIATEAALPVTSAADGQSATGRSVSELIEADKYLAAKAASKRKRRGLTFGKLIPPGAAGDCRGGCGGHFDGGC